MNTMAPTRPAELHACRVQPTTGRVAAAEARSQVRAPSCGRDAAAGAGGLPVGAETRRCLPTALPAERDCHLIRAGKAAYFTLALQSPLATGGGRGPGWMP